MHSIPQSVSDAASRDDAGTAVANVMMNGMRQLADLHIGLMRATLEQGNIAARQLWSARNSRQFLFLAAEQVRPNAQRTFDYGYYLATIAAETQSGILRAVGGHASGRAGTPRPPGM